MTDGICITKNMHMEQNRLRMMVSTMVSDPTASIHTIYKARRRIRRIDEILMQPTKLQKTMSKTKSLRRFGKVASLIMANNICDRNELYIIDGDRCTECARVLSLDMVGSLMICDSCHTATQTLFVVEDMSTDVLINKFTSSSTKFVKKSKVIKSENIDPKSPLKPSRYERHVLYRKYLHQFTSTAPPIPDEVMSVIYKYTSSIHLATSVRCRVTPTVDVLKNSGFIQYVPYASLITRMFNGMPIPVISESLVDKLVERFRLVTDAMIKRSQEYPKPSGNRGKILAFEIATAIGLLAEGEDSISILFNVHKTRSVLNKVTSYYLQIVHDILVPDTSHTLDWSRVTHLC